MPDQRWTYRGSLEACPHCKRPFEAPDVPEVERLRAALMVIAEASDITGARFVAQEALHGWHVRRTPDDCWWEFETYTPTEAKP